jgi:hypothetical protein
VARKKDFFAWLSAKKLTGENACAKLVNLNGPRNQTRAGMRKTVWRNCSRKYRYAAKTAAGGLSVDATIVPHVLAPMIFTSGPELYSDADCAHVGVHRADGHRQADLGGDLGRQTGSRSTGV